jgi:hypothetical protein
VVGQASAVVVVVDLVDQGLLPPPWSENLKGALKFLFNLWLFSLSREFCLVG